MTGALPFDVPYSNIIAHITAGIDVDVYYKELDQTEIRVHQNLNEIKEGSLELLNLLKDITYANFRDNNSYSKYIESNYKRLRKIEIDGKSPSLPPESIFAKPFIVSVLKNVHGECQNVFNAAKP